MTELATEKSSHLGIASMAIAAIALMIAVAHLSLGPFEPQQPIEETIVETAVKIKDAARRAVSGAPAPGEETPPPSRWNIDRIVEASVLAAAALAIFLALAALVRKEQKTPAFFGFSLGAGVLVMAWLQWIALIICGVVIIAAVISNLDQILS